MSAISSIGPSDTQIEMIEQKESKAFLKQLPDLHQLLTTALAECKTSINEQHMKREELKASRGYSVYKASHFIGSGFGIGLAISGVVTAAFGIHQTQTLPSYQNFLIAKGHHARGAPLNVTSEYYKSELAYFNNNTKIGEDYQEHLQENREQNNFGKKLGQIGLWMTAASVPVYVLTGASIRVAIRKLTGTDFTATFKEVSDTLSELEQKQARIHTLYEEGILAAKFCNAVDKFQADRNSTTRSKVAMRYKELMDTTLHNKLPQKIITHLLENDVSIDQAFKESVRDAFQEDVDLLLGKKNDPEKAQEHDGNLFEVSTRS